MNGRVVAAPVSIRNRVTGGVATLLVVVVVILIVLAIIFFISYTTTAGYQQNGVSSQQVRLNCTAGQCTVNIFTGDKQCPADAQTVLTADPLTEVCSSASYCDNDQLPYAEQSDGSTDPLGVCEPGVTCRCFKNPRCPNYIVSTFTAIDGNPYLPIDTQRIKFEQNVSYTSTNQYGQTQLITTPPLRLTNPDTDFCSIPVRWRKRMAPRKCKNGVLALLPPDPLRINYTNVAVGCVARGLSCQPGDIEVWDPRVNLQTCTHNGTLEPVVFTCTGFESTTFTGTQILLNSNVMVLKLIPPPKLIRQASLTDVVNIYGDKLFEARILRGAIPERFWAPPGQLIHITTVYAPAYPIQITSPPATVSATDEWQIYLNDQGNLIFHYVSAFSPGGWFVTKNYPGNYHVFPTLLLTLTRQYY